jgi:hypothetical protein
VASNLVGNPVHAATATPKQPAVQQQQQTQPDGKKEKE